VEEIKHEGPQEHKGESQASRLRAVGPSARTHWPLLGLSSAIPTGLWVRLGVRRPEGLGRDLRGAENAPLPIL
jgi:hypothetical protein